MKHAEDDIMNAITVTINGRHESIEGGSSLSDLLAQLELDPRTVVVEHNRSIVRRPSLDATTLNAGDTVELVHFVGGG